MVNAQATVATMVARSLNQNCCQPPNSLADLALGQGPVSEQHSGALRRRQITERRGIDADTDEARFFDA
jgi:hypothetical protein